MTIETKNPWSEVGGEGDSEGFRAEKVDVPDDPKKILPLYDTLEANPNEVGKTNNANETSEQINKIKESLKDSSPEGRVSQLQDRGVWLRDLAQRAQTDPSSIREQDVKTLIKYVEEFEKSSASAENKTKIDDLSRSLKMNLPETAEGSNIIFRAASGFADQYERLVHRETLRKQGVQRRERVAATMPTGPVIKEPQAKRTTLLSKIRGWFKSS